VEVDDIVVMERKDIAENLKQGQICRLINEWIYFDKLTGKLYSLDSENWNKREIDLEVFDISVTDFWCKDFGSQFFILHQKKENG